MIEQTALVQFDKARLALAEAVKIDEVKLIRDQAEALRQYIRQQGASLEMQNQAAEIKLRAERRAGEMLKEQILHGGGRPTEKPSHDVIVSSVPTLAELGITPMQSQRWQLEATILEANFEKFIAETKASGDELTSRALRIEAIKAKSNDKATIADLELPTGRYRTIVIDPPWPMEKIIRDERPNQVDMDYPTMTIDEIKAIKLPAYEDGCHVYLWTTQKHIQASFQLFEAWGVKFQCLLAWVKNVGFTPFSWMYSTEFCLFGRIGNLQLLKLGIRTDFGAKVREHSRKPDEFYEIVRQVSPEPRIDYFSREKHEGFTSYGNEPNKFN